MLRSVPEPREELVEVLNRIACALEQLGASVDFPQKSFDSSAENVRKNLLQIVRSTYVEDEIDQWKIVVSIYPGLEVFRSRLACMKQEIADSFRQTLIASKDFANGKLLALKLEEIYFASLSTQSQERLDYVKSLLDRQQWAASKTWLNFIEIVGPEVDFEFLRIRLIEIFPEILIFSPDDLFDRATPLSQLSTARNIREIEARSVNDPIKKIRQSAAGRFYVNWIKPYPAARNFATWGWKLGYPFYVNSFAGRLFSSKGRKRLSLVPLSEYVALKGLSKFVLIEEQVVLTPNPDVFPAASKSALISPHTSYKFPEVFVTHLSKTVVFGGSNLVAQENLVVCHDLYNFSRDYTSEELHGRAIIDTSKHKIRVLSDSGESEVIPVAASFLDACSKNYAHWVTEVLPRIALFCSLDEFKSVPLIVDDGLHKNMMESLLLVSGVEREVLTLPIGQSLNVDKLYVTSVAGYVPFERRLGSGKSGHSHGLFSASAFDLLCRIVAQAKLTLPSPELPKKLYLRRNSGMRIVKNAKKLEQFLAVQGFVFVEPEKLDFFQQVRLFSNAKVILGSSGAALVNMVFAPPEAVVVVLIAEYPDTSYWYWQNIACASKKSVRYILGRAERDDKNGIHSNFTVEIDDVRKCLRDLV